MEWVLAVLAVVIIGLAAVAGSGRLGQFPATSGDRPAPVLPAAPLTAADINALRFAVVPRGYAMDQVDAVLDRLADQLAGTPAGAIGTEPGIMGG